MVTNPTSSEFHERNTTKKGDAGERILARIAHGFFPGAVEFAPLIENGAHQCDRILVSWRDRRIVLVDAKAKPARSYYPDTGINVASFDIYRDMAQRHRALVLLCFIDEACQIAYGNFLHILAKPHKVWWRGEHKSYPLEDWGNRGRIVFFPIEYMRRLADLAEEEVVELRLLSTRGDFKPSGDVYSRLGVALAENSWLPAQQQLV